MDVQKRNYKNNELNIEIVMLIRIIRYGLRQKK